MGTKTYSETCSYFANNHRVGMVDDELVITANFARVLKAPPRNNPEHTSLDLSGPITTYITLLFHDESGVRSFESTCILSHLLVF